MTQPEALRLADALEMSSNHGIRREAAAELRLLHAELERCKQVCAATSESWRTDAEKWKGQRDALLEALRDLVDAMTGRLDGETIALHNALIVLAKAEAA